MHYPAHPGHKAPGTSAESAARIAPDAAKLRDCCLSALALKSMTADEVAALLERSVLSVRPRIAELKRMGKISDTGQRRENASGHRAAVWQAN